MNWSSKWDDDAAKVFQDAALHGIGYAKDGKHIPLKEVFHFQDGNKKRSLDIIIIGDLALDYDDDGWNIYHVPTGTVFTKAVPTFKTDIQAKCTLYEQSELLEWMKKVQENYPASWTMLRLLTPDNYRDKGESAKRIIKEWCLSVKVKE